MTTPPLKQGLGLVRLVLYGLGTTIGAGIYALIGEIAGIAGYWAPFSFLIAAALAALTACSFAELSGRYPQAAGSALYIEKAFLTPTLALMIGLTVCAAGVTSAAALINSLVNYLQLYVAQDRITLIVMLTLIIGGIAIWGIIESVTIAAIITIIEVGGLLSIIIASRDAYLDLPELLPAMLPPLSFSSAITLSSGAILAFYAFIGFEDMVEVAEEVSDAKKTLPRAILITITVTTLLYTAIMLAAVLALHPSVLAQSKAPLSLLFSAQTGLNGDFLTVIAMIAVLNGAIIQIIMSSRVLYGLSSRGHIYTIFSKVNPQTQTPIMATVFIMLCITALSFIGDLSQLAKLTSLLVIGIYAAVNLALWRLKKETPRVDGVFCVPSILPFIGFICCLAFIIAQII